MRKTLVIMVILPAAFLLSVTATAATIEGAVQGYTCVTEGRICPLTKNDPLVEAENVFVVLTMSQGYYFVPNISRDTMASLINQQCKIIGQMNRKYNSIRADALYTWRNGQWELVLQATSGRGKE